MDNKLKIINYLGKNMRKTFTMHELSKILNIPYATFYRTIKLIAGLLVINTIGKSKTLKLNLNKPIIKSYLAIASDEEKKEYLKNQPIIRKIAHETQTDDIILLFGSYADNTQTKTSDIDLLIINKDGKRTISFKIHELLFKKRINPIFMTKREFQLMLRTPDENVGKQALKKHIVLKKPARFWDCVLNGIQKSVQ